MPKAEAPLRWLPEAAADLERLRAFLDPKNPIVAEQAALQVIAGTERLRRHPKAGRVIAKLPMFRDLFVPFGAGAYVIRYG